MDNALNLSYNWTRRTREVLLEFTDSLAVDVYTLERPDFAYGSIRNIHAHIAFCYLYWVGVAGLGYDAAKLRIPDDQIPDVAAMRQRFKFVDSVMDEALEKFNNPDEMFVHTHRTGDLKLTQRWLFAHPITHEFHHKGQLLALARVLGHPLPGNIDTDLILPFD